MGILRCHLEDPLGRPPGLRRHLKGAPRMGQRHRTREPYALRAPKGGPEAAKRQKHHPPPIPTGEQTIEPKTGPNTNRICISSEPEPADLPLEYSLLFVVGAPQTSEYSPYQKPSTIQYCRAKAGRNSGISIVCCAGAATPSNIQDVLCPDPRK